MKQKFLKLCSIIATCFVLLFAVTGCGDRAVLNLEIKSGTFEYTYEKDDAVSFENLVVIVHYNDETSKEVKYGDEGLTVSPLSTETIGKKEVVITYEKKSVTLEVTVKTPSETTLLVRSIATLPDTEEINASNRAAITEMRTKYDALSEEGKAKITLYSVLQAAEAKLAALDLAAHKESAKADLNGYKNEADYSSAKWALVVAAKDSGITAITNATTIEEVNTALASAKTTIDAIDTKVVELAAHKTAVKLEFDAYIQANYSATNWTSVRVTIYEAKAAIDSANTVEAVNAILANAKTELNAIPTITQEFATYKANKLNTLQSMFNIVGGHIVDAQSNRLYDDTNEELVLTALNTAVSTITNATTTADIDAAYDIAVGVIDGAKLKVVTDVIAMIADLTDVTIEDKLAVEAARDAYDALSNENKAKVTNYSTLQAAEATISSLQDIALVRSEWKNRLDSNFKNNLEFMNKYDTDEQNIILGYITAAKEEIDNATVNSDIIDIYNETVANINTVKEKVVTVVEDLLDSLNITIELSHESTIANVRAKYNQLSGAQKDSISADKYAYLTNAESEIVRLKFEQHKTLKLAELDAKLADCGNNKYNPTNYGIIEGLINAAKAKINDTTLVATQEQVDEVVQDVMEDIAKIKIKLVTDVEDLIAGLVDYENQETAVYSGKVAEAKAAFNSLETNDYNYKGLVANYSDLVAAEAKVVAKELADAKAAAIATLNAYLPANKTENDYGPTKMETIKTLRINGATSINQAATPEAVALALQEAQSSINAVATQDQDHYTIIGWNKPANIQEFEDALNATGEAAYLDTSDRTYYVGYDNAFKLQPVIEAEAPSSTTSETITEYRNKSIIKMSTDGGETYSVVLKDDLGLNTVTEGYTLNDYIEYIGEYTFEYDFTEAAKDKFFEISVYPYYGYQYAADVDGIEDDYHVVTHQFKVVDGYNVYKAVELGMMHNSVEADETSERYDVQGVTPYNEWKTLLNQRGYTLRDVKAIILQNSIDITKNDIPASYFDGAYLHDYVAIYEHAVSDKFDFYGNYFTVDASALPIVDTSVANDAASHTPLFKIWAGDVCGTKECYQALSTGSNKKVANFKNVTVIGNGKIASNETAKGMGSLIMGKFLMVETNLTNMNVNSFLINLFPDDRANYFGVANINYVKSRGAFQNNMFAYGGSVVNVANSDFGQCGGPSIISATSPYDPSKRDNGVPIINVDSVTKIVSLVTGTEPWFDQYQPGVGALLGALQQVDVLIDTVSGETKGILNEEGKMNLIDGGIQIVEGNFGTYTGIFSIGLETPTAIGNTFASDLVNTGGNPIPTMADLASYGALAVFGSDGSVLITDGTNIYQSSGNFTGAKYVSVYLPIRSGDTVVGGFTVVLECY